MELVKDELKIKIFDTRERMGRAAADDVAFCIKKLLAQKECINMIFAAASLGIGSVLSVGVLLSFCVDKKK